MFVGGLPFLVTSLRNIKMATEAFVPTRTARQLANSIMKVVHIYSHRGFVVNISLLYMEFVKVTDLCKLVEVITTAAQEHIPNIERLIRLIRDRLRCITYYFHFTSVPNMVLIHILYSVNMMLNEFSRESGVTGYFSPRKLVIGRTINCLKDCHADIDVYVDSSTDVMVTYNLTPRTHSCIALGMSGNC